ncbi:MAG TPA: sugar phosphate isomerase/epimerase family protein [Candidatus Paceibacterota bacterium]|nr:sugar phosphate isomerase/epimerase family protein [Verrucomicrobiota bacterium]HSA10257.1 sugar phosphate isomerase/epimerase family protein [Candidatus Paceibacterota bacterium]
MITISRREFIAQTSLAATTTAFCGAWIQRGFTAEPWPPPIVVFSKIYQALKLNFDDAAALTAEAGIDGIDCPVRPGGEILPEQAATRLPEYAAALNKHSLQVPLLTTGITGVSSPNAEEILRTAKQHGVRFYRLGFVLRKPEVPADQQVREVQAQLKDLAALNKAVGLGAILQNHSPTGRNYVGGDLADMYEIVKEFDPAQVGVAFDIGHALVVHGNEWRGHFDKLKSHIKVAYVKDVTRAGRWVPFGQGDIGGLGYFKLLRQTGCRAPISLHIEFDWSGGGKSRTRSALIKALRDSARVLRGWLAEA